MYIMRKNLVILTFVMLSISLIHGQNNRQASSQEKIFVHYNSSLLFTGEYLFYKLYLNEADKNYAGKLSGFAYLELISETGNKVFQHIVKLDDGVGYGDYFVNSDVPSGNYKIVAYTEYMRNFSFDYFFQADITVINPYLSDQSSLLQNSNNNRVGAKPYSHSVAKEEIASNYRGTGFEPLELEISGNSFGTREKISIQIRNVTREAGFGNYSISVRKIDRLPGHQRLSVYLHEKNFREMRTNSDIDFTGKTVYRKERDGVLFKGVINPDSVRIDQDFYRVAISTGGDNFKFDVVRSDGDGNFSFMFDPDQYSDELIIQVLGEQPNTHELSIRERPGLNYDFLQFKKFRIEPFMQSAIIERSVRNQIENGYYSLKPDTIKVKSYPRSFVGYERFTTYDLDDYTRFPTMAEVFTEIVKFVWTERKEGQRRIRIFQREFSTPSEDPPLIFIDGFFIQYHNELLALDANIVKRIRVLRNAYEFGGKDYLGVLLIETIEGDYKPDTAGSYIVSSKFTKPVAEKRYFRQVHSDSSAALNNRIPDYRQQLLWQPAVRLKSGSWSEAIYTSDVAGEYEVIVQGYTNSNIPVSMRKTFIVKPGQSP